LPFSAAVRLSEKKRSGEVSPCRLKALFVLEGSIERIDKASDANSKNEDHE
jgi:hypothetical protein